MKEFFHILNPSRRRKDHVRLFFEKNPALEFMWVERASHPTHLETLVQWAVNEGRSSIAVWGGDGTLSRVVQCLYDMNALKKVAIMLAPFGTCNDFARRLNSPGEQVVDIGLLEMPSGKRIFVNNAGFGRAAGAIHRRSNPIRDIFSFSTKSLDLEWTLDGARRSETRPALLGIVFNAPYFNGGMHFEESPDPGDGVLNGYFESPHSRLNLLFKFMKSRLGGPLTDRHTFRLDFQTLRANTDQDVFPQVDGEAAAEDPVRSMTFSVIPKTLRITLWR